MKINKVGEMMVKEMKKVMVVVEKIDVISDSTCETGDGEGEGGDGEW